MPNKLFTEIFLSSKEAILDKICMKYRVKQLCVFGSILTEKFSNTSDIDLTVTFHKDQIKDYFLNYFSLKEELEKLTGREIDLIEYDAIKNIYFKKEVDSHKCIVYES